MCAVWGENNRDLQGCVILDINFIEWIYLIEFIPNEVEMLIDNDEIAEDDDDGDDSHDEITSWCH